MEIGMSMRLWFLVVVLLPPSGEGELLLLGGVMQLTALARWCESSQPQCKFLLFLAESLVSAGSAMGWFVIGHV